MICNVLRDCSVLLYTVICNILGDCLSYNVICNILNSLKGLFSYTVVQCDIQVLSWILCDVLTVFDSSHQLFTNCYLGHRIQAVCPDTRARMFLMSESERSNAAWECCLHSRYHCRRCLFNWILCIGLIRPLYFFIYVYIQWCSSKKRSDRADNCLGTDESWPQVEKNVDPTLPYVTFSALFIRNWPIPPCPPLPPFPHFLTFPPPQGGVSFYAKHFFM